MAVMSEPSRILARCRNGSSTPTRLGTELPPRCETSWQRSLLRGSGNGPPRIVWRGNPTLESWQTHFNTVKVLAVDAGLFQAASEGGLLVVDVSHLTPGTMAPRDESAPFKWTFDGIHCLPPVFIQAAREVLSVVVYAEEADEPGLASASTAKTPTRTRSASITTKTPSRSVSITRGSQSMSAYLSASCTVSPPAIASQRASGTVAASLSASAGFSEAALAASASSTNRIIVLSCAAINVCFIIFVCRHRVVGLLSACSHNSLPEVSISPT